MTAQPNDLDRLIVSHDAMSASFDGTLTTLAGGSLALSISFVTDIAKHPSSVWAIQASWVLMGVALGLMLGSHALSVEVHRRIIYGDIEGTPYESQPRWVRWGVTYTNWLAGVTFLAGAALLVFFAFVNV
jgi:hypothetical protein